MYVMALCCIVIAGLFGPVALVSYFAGGKFIFPRRVHPVGVVTAA